MQIIVLGMHRSGTSMITRLINMLGAYIGPEHSLLEYHSKRLSSGNSKGHWERRDVMDINNAILAKHGATWDAPVTEETLSHENTGRVQQEAAELCVYGLDSHRPWVLKDPRMCLTLPSWKPHLEMPLVIFVTRNPEEIALSLQKRNNIPKDKAFALWEYYIANALNASLDIPRFFVDYEEMMLRPGITLSKCYDWLASEGCRGISMPHPKELGAFIDPDLYRAKSTSDNIGFLNTNQQQIWQILRGNMPQIGYMQCADSSKELLRKTIEV